MYPCKAMLVLAFLGFAGVEARAQENECQLSMKARVGVVTGTTLLPAGEAIVQSCRGLYITFVEKGETLAGKEVFSKAGYDHFSMNLEYIALLFMNPVPDEFVPDNKPFMYFPDPATITADHSDLAISFDGRADTIVFRFSDASPVTVLQFYETSGLWFGDNAYSGD